MSAYHFCPIRDGLLYVEVPHFSSLIGLLLQQKWKDHAHLRTVDGSIPYYGGGIAFHAFPLILRGVRPIWWVDSKTEYDSAIVELLEDGVFRGETAAMRHHDDRYKKECEWRGPIGMRFNLEEIDHVWTGIGSKKKGNIKEMGGLLREFLPDNIPIIID